MHDVHMHTYYAPYIYIYVHTEIDPLLTHEQLMCFLAFPSVVDKWYDIGLILHLPPSQLMEIYARHCDKITCMSETFKEWMTRKTTPCTWEVVLQVLRSDTIREYELAHHIQIHLQQSCVQQHLQAAVASTSHQGKPLASCT